MLKTWLRGLIFLAGWCVFFSQTLTITVNGLRESRNSVSADDHLGWMIKATELQDCPRGDCRYLKDIESQTSLKNVPHDIKFIRWREGHCLVHVYTPLYSALLWGFKSAISHSWEQAYYDSDLLSTTTIALGIGAFLAVGFGLLPAGLALFFLGTFGTSVHQWASPTPSRLASGLLFLFAALLMQFRGRGGKWLPVYVTTLCLLHPMGRLWSVVLIVLQTRQSGKKLFSPRASWISWAFISSLSMWVTHPAFKFPYLDSDWVGYRELFYEQMRTVPFILNASIRPALDVRLFDKPVGAMILLTILFLLTPFRYKNDLGARVVIAGVFAASLLASFHLMYPYAGELFGRMQAPILVVYAGGFAAAAIEGARRLWIKRQEARA